MTPTSRSNKDNRIIHINESQYRRLFEAYTEKFDFSNLSMIIADERFEGNKTFGRAIEYCDKTLGKTEYIGTSRAVYLLSDEVVLKVAMNEKGIAQNEAEWNLFKKMNSPLLPIIHNHDENFYFLLVEHVIPTEYGYDSTFTQAKTDIERIVGMPFDGEYTQKTNKRTLYGDADAEVGYDKYFQNPREGESNVTLIDILYYLQGGGERNSYYESIIDTNYWLYEFRRLVNEGGLWDVYRLYQFGIVNRDGKELLVILDSGFNEDVFNNHYK